MSRETFMAREKDMIVLEEQNQNLREALSEERRAMEQYMKRVKALEALADSAREMEKEWAIQAQQDKIRWGLTGLVIGGLVVAIGR